MKRLALGVLLLSRAFAQNCPANGALGDPAAKPSWNGWGVGFANTRFQPADAAKLNADQVSKLKLKWAFGFPGAKAVYGQPTVVSGRVFLGVDTGEVYSIDAATGCMYWSYKAEGPVRSAITVGPAQASGQYLAYFGDLKGNVYAVNAATGAQAWKMNLDNHPVARITGAPQLYQSKLYVPVASFEEVSGANPDYECCKFRGSVAALEAQTGKVLWKTYIIPEAPKPTVKNAKGVQQYGPSGGGVWNAPTLDLKKKALYVGTGDSYSGPAAKTTDAIVAIDMENGKMLWSIQDTPGDAWNVACSRPTGNDNCPKDAGPDYDYGSSPILKTLPNGKRVLITGQKSGNVWAHDPDRKGAVVWKTGVFTKEPDSSGQIVWGGSADDSAAYFGVNSGGVVSLALNNGERNWFANLEPPAGRQTGHSAAVSEIPGVIFSGSKDGVLRALNAKDGKVIWDFDTMKDFQTVNGVPAKGGAMGSAGMTIANGMVFAGCGYAGAGAAAAGYGNVLLAFAAE